MKAPAPGLRAALITAALLAPSIAAAQAPLEIPQASQKARSEQRVGITDFAIDYSSPGVKGRKIWGELVPFDKVWRAGANASTKLTANRDFSLGGTLVKAGTYSVFITPGKASWTVVLNSDAGASQDSYDAKRDVAKLAVKPIALPAARERLLWLFSDAQEDKATLDLEWEKVRIRVPLTVDTKAQVAAQIERATGEAWVVHWMAANYAFESGDAARALPLVDKSIAIQPVFRNTWLRARVLWKQGQKAEARTAAARAQELGKGTPGYENFYKAEVTKTLASWK